MYKRQSKGLLFHYFESKLGVYTFVYDYSVRFMTLELKSAVDPGETDLFGLMKQVEMAHMQAMKGYPYMQQLDVYKRQFQACLLRKAAGWLASSPTVI